jgi:hypothetical protein
VSRQRVRTFACSSRGQIRRFPAARLERLLARGERAHEFAGKEIGFASVLVVDEAGQVGVSVVEAVRLRFDRAGKPTRTSSQRKNRRLEWRPSREETNEMLYLALESTDDMDLP